MEYYELKLVDQIEVKLIRINKPRLNNSILPISGEYSSFNFLDNIQNPPHQENLVKYFNITEGLSITNLFQISNNFGKSLLGETIEALIIAVNLSKVDDLKVKDFRITLSNKPTQGNANKFLKVEFSLLQLENLIIPAGKYFSQKVNFKVDILCEYLIFSEVQYSCNYFNNEYNKNSNGKIIKTKNDKYFIEVSKSNVIKIYHKTMKFENLVPFKIKDKILGSNLERGFIEFSISNITNTNLRLIDISISYNKSQFHIKEDKLIGDEQKNIILPVSQFEEMILESDDEHSFLYYIQDYNEFLKIELFVIKLSWVNMFDSILKNISFSIKNKNFNDIFTLSIMSKPENDQVTKGQIFEVKFLIKNISEKEVNIKVNYERESIKEIDIIDILPKVCFINTNQSEIISLSCKAEVCGVFIFPKITITDEISKRGIIYEKLIKINSVK